MECNNRKEYSQQENNENTGIIYGKGELEEKCKCELIVNNIYEILIEKEFKAPAAEKVWGGGVFPQLEK